MPTRQFGSVTVEVDAEGFLASADTWNRDVAEGIAQELGIAPLSDRHWKVIDFCRGDAASQGQAPGLRRIAKMSGVPMKELYQLFPKGPGKLAARVSGLPKPKSCI